MDQATKSLYCSLYEFLEKNQFSATKKNFVKETKFDVSLLEDASVVKVSLSQIFQDHLASLKKEVINEESSDSSSSDSDSESDEPVAKKLPATESSSSSDSDSSDSDSDEEDNKKVESSSSSDSDSSDEDEDEEKVSSANVIPSKSPSDSDSTDSSSESESESDKKKSSETNGIDANSSSDDSDSSDSDSDNDINSGSKKTATTPSSDDSSSSDSDSEEEDEGKKSIKRKADSLEESTGNSDSATNLVDNKSHSPSVKKLKMDKANGTSATFKAYIKGLPWITSEDEVSSFFSDCGSIVNVELPLAEGGRSSGTAFVTFDSKEGLDAALAKDEAIWPGTERWLKITEAKSFDTGRAGPPTERPAGCDTVFVGNLPWDVEESQLMDLFSSCGEVMQVRFATGEDGSFRGFAHVRFGSEESTDSAVALYGTYVNDRAIRVDYAPPRNRDSLGGGKGGGRGGFGGKGGGKGGGRGGKGGTPYSAKKKIMSPQGTKTTFD
jgi:nucleolin